ncbi:MAG: CD3324 family protein [Bacillota bacterium]
MKYKKAHEVLPEKLLKEIQKYVKGEMIYIPSPPDSRKGWGEDSGSRAYLKERNSEIKQRFQQGITIDQLTLLFCLSYDSIKKIVYSKH